jgi:hypothetical protein
MCWTWSHPIKELQLCSFFITIRKEVGMSQRLKGFIVGCDPGQTSEKTVCKVRVKDPSSEYDGQKFVVVSVRDGLELAQGLNVNFVLGTMDGEPGKQILRAVDVCLEVPDSK